MFWSNARSNQFCRSTILSKASISKSELLCRVPNQGHRKGVDASGLCTLALHIEPHLGAIGQQSQRINTLGGIRVRSASGSIVGGKALLLLNGLDLCEPFRAKRFAQGLASWLLPFVLGVHGIHIAYEEIGPSQCLLLGRRSETFHAFNPCLSTASVDELRLVPVTEHKVRPTTGLRQKIIRRTKLGVDGIVSNVPECLLHFLHGTARHILKNDERRLSQFGQIDRGPERNGRSASAAQALGRRGEVGKIDALGTGDENVKAFGD
mmetsp:Transcript_12269/g.35110  ORF Transcript_12269/g.35110 Transcript_12269/m.35110 type:complete len:265 (+) Transcript_12269:3449-4243(+)